MNLVEQAKQQAAKLKNQQKEAEKSGFERKVPPAGKTIARLVSYIEVGVHDQKPFQGKPKPPAAECHIQFQLLGKKHRNEYEDGEGNKKVSYPVVSAKVPMKSGERAGFTKLLKALDYGRGNTHIAFMLGEAFYVTIVHNTQKNTDGQEVTYANFKDGDGNWLISAPVIQKYDEDGEPVGKPQPVNPPTAPAPLRLLLWDAPTIEQWESIYIDGTRKQKVGGEEVEVSNNWLQEKVRSANNFEGSPIQNLILSHIDGDLPDMSDEDDESGSDDLPEDDEDDSGTQGADEDEGAESGSEDEGDPFADLGVDDDEIPF